MINVAKPIQLVIKFECSAVGSTGGSSLRYAIGSGTEASTDGRGEGTPSKRGDLEVLRNGTPGRDASGFRSAGYKWVRGERAESVDSVRIELDDRGISSISSLC